MLITEEKLRKLCRGDQGAFESAPFQDALNASEADPVPVTFTVDFDEFKTVHIPRQECEFYAQIAEEEAEPEAEILKHINPMMHLWVKNNRSKMCSRLKEAMVKYTEEHRVPGQGVVIVWTLCAPDQVSPDIVENYLRRYA